MAKTIRGLVRAFLLAEGRRVKAARAYGAALEKYFRLRSPQRKFDFYYGTLLPALVEADRTRQVRIRAGEALERERTRRRKPRVLEPGLLPAGTEFEFTAVTEGGTPGKGK